MLLLKASFLTNLALVDTEFYTFQLWFRWATGLTI
jgi:hypothetical protein